MWTKHIVYKTKGYNQCAICEGGGGGVVKQVVTPPSFYEKNSTMKLYGLWILLGYFSKLLK